MRKLIITLVIVLSVVTAALPVGSMVAAQDESSLVIWHTLTPEAEGAVEDAIRAYEQQQPGVVVQLETMPSQVLFDEVNKAQQAGGGPDVILTGSDSLATLLKSGLIEPQSERRAFFLSALLDAMPDLLVAECDPNPVNDCLWPRLSPELVTTELDSRMLDRTWNWLCGAAEWMVPCEGSSWPGAPISWWFNIYLINETWLAENGLDVPSNVETLDDMRGAYGLDYVWARQGSIPLAEDARANAIYVMPSALISSDPNGLMSAMDNFNQAGYMPVLELGIDGAYVSATAANPAQAADFVTFLNAQPVLKADIAAAKESLPAVGPAELPVLSDSGDTLRAVLTLISYSAVAN